MSELLEEKSFISFPNEDSIDIAKRMQVPRGIAFNSAFLNCLYGLFGIFSAFLA